MCSKSPTTSVLSTVLSHWLHPCTTKVFQPPLSTLDGAHVRNNTWLSLPAQLHYCLLEWGSLWTRLIRFWFLEATITISRHQDVKNVVLLSDQYWCIQTLDTRPYMGFPYQLKLNVQVPHLFTKETLILFALQVTNTHLILSQSVSHLPHFLRVKTWPLGHHNKYHCFSGNHACQFPPA